MTMLRQLEADHKKYWDNLSKPDPNMEVNQDCDPVLLSGWTDPDISLWDVSADTRKPGLEKILIALCRRKPKNWDKISYLLFPEETVSLAGLNLTASNGKTGDQRVDISGTHFELKGITGKQLCTLIFHVSHSKFVTGLFKRTDYDRVMFEAYDRTITESVVESSTSSITDLVLPFSGTQNQPTDTTLTLEPAQKETQTFEFPPSSSTAHP